MVAVLPTKLTPGRRRTVADAGGAEENPFADDELVRGVNAFELFLRDALQEVLPLFIIAWPHAEVDFSTESLERCGGEDACLPGTPQCR